MKAIYILAAKELQDGLRNRWVISIILILGSLALLLLLLSAAPGGTVKASVLHIGVVNLTSLSVYLIPLIALMLSFDALVGEFERGTMLLLLTYPLARWQIIMGKFAGHLLILAITITLGYGGSALFSVLYIGGSAGWEQYALMMLSSFMLGAIFLLVGYLISVLSYDRSVAIAVAIGGWLFFVVLYDLALLGVLLAGNGQIISEDVFTILMLINPTDLYRAFNISSVTGSESITHIVGVIKASELNLTLIISIFFLWLTALLSLVIWRFQRREI